MRGPHPNPLQSTGEGMRGPHPSPLQSTGEGTGGRQLNVLIKNHLLTHLLTYSLTHLLTHLLTYLKPDGIDRNLKSMVGKDDCEKQF